MLTTTTLAERDSRIAYKGVYYSLPEVSAAEARLRRKIQQAEKALAVARECGFKKKVARYYRAKSTASTREYRHISAVQKALKKQRTAEIAKAKKIAKAIIEKRQPCR